MEEKIKNVIRITDSFYNKFKNISLFGVKISQEDLNEATNILNKFQYLPGQKVLNFKKQNMRLADVGCWTGFITLVLNEIAGEMDHFVYAIDNFKRDDNAEFQFISSYLNIKTILNECINDYGASSTIKIDEGDSDITASHYANEYFDVIFINAWHFKCNEFTKDLKYWYPKLKKDGLILGYNYDIKDLPGIKNYNNSVDFDNPFNVHIGIIKGLKEFFGDKVNKTEKGSIWWVKKNG